MTTDNPQTVSLVAGAATVTFAERFGYVEFENHSASDAMWARTDGNAAVAGADGTYYIAPGENMIIANGNPMWFQGFGGPEGTVQSGGAIAANPGTSICVVGTGTDSLTIVGR